MFTRSESHVRRLEVGPCSQRPRLQDVRRIVTFVAFGSCFQALEQLRAAIETNFEICELIEAARNG